MTELEKCTAGLWYHTESTGLGLKHLIASDLCAKYNRIRPSNISKRQQLLGKILGRVGYDCYIEPSLQCSYGLNLEVGDHFFANSNCFFMDDAKITFGDHVFIGPNCAFYTAQHPIHPIQRNRKIERALPISVGNNVWFGGNCVVLPGVNIGSNTVIGAGSIVTNDIPDNVVAVGNPCRVLRSITDADLLNGEESFYIPHISAI